MLFISGPIERESFDGRFFVVYEKDPLDHVKDPKKKADYLKKIIPDVPVVLSDEEEETFRKKKEKQQNVQNAQSLALDEKTKNKEIRMKIVKFLLENAFHELFENDNDADTANKRKPCCKCCEKGEKKFTYPLHQAVEKNNLEMVKFLIDFGAKLSRKGCKGDTALEKAVNLNKDKSHEEIITALKEAMAKKK